MIYTPEEINQLIVDIHSDNVAAGWWDHADVDPLEKLGLTISELSEATEGVRKDLIDDKLPHRKMEEVEMADAFIRLCDFAGRYGIGYGIDNSGEQAQSFLAAYSQAKNPVGQIAIIKGYAGVTVLSMSVDEGRPDPTTMLSWGITIYGIIHHCQVRGLDLRGAVEEKRTFNKTRPDHTREARAADNGKKY